MRMVREQRRSAAGVNKENRAVIFKTILRDAVNEPGHRFAGINRVKQNAFETRQQLHRFHALGHLPEGPRRAVPL